MGRDGENLRRGRRADDPAITEAAPATVGAGARVTGGLLFAFAALLYARSLGSGFVYDSVAQVLNDPFIHEPRNLLDVLSLRVMGQDVIDFNRPVHLLSLMLDALLWGKRPLGFHLSSVLLHAGTVLLLFAVLVRWRAQEDRRAGSGDPASAKTPTTGGPLRALAPAALASALFAAHPLLTETVAEPSYREDLLAGFFVLAALWLASGWRASFSGRDLVRSAGVVICAFLAVGAKENGVAVIPALLVLWWWRRREDPRAPWAWLLGACVLAVAAFLIARFALQPATSTIFVDPPQRLGGSLAGSLRIVPRIWASYLLHIVWPARLSVDYTGASIAGFPLGLALLLIAALVLGQAYVARRGGLMLMSAVLFWAALLPASNLLPMYRPAADRYLYVPMLGVACAVAALGHWLAAHPSRQRWRRPAAGVAVLLVAVLASATFRRQAVFASELALWTATAEVEPNSITVQDNLGWALLEAGRPTEALKAFHRTVQLSRAKSGDPYAGAALALVAMGQPERALVAMRRAVTVEPLYGDPASLARTRRLRPHQIEGLKPLLAKLK